MLPGGTTETIQWFAGYLHVYDQTLHAGYLYRDPAIPGKVGEDPNPWVPGSTTFTPANLLLPIPTNIGVPDGDDDLARAHGPYLPHGGGGRITFSGFLTVPAPKDYFVPAQPSISGFSVQYETVYPPATEENVNAVQINHLISTDHLSVDPNSLAVQAAESAAPHLIAEMVGTAQDLLPAGLATVETNGNILLTSSLDAVKFIEAHDAYIAAHPAAAPGMMPGEYVNGVFDPNYGTPIPQLVIPEQPGPPINIDGHLTPGLELVAGSNSQVNEAAIIQDNPHSTMMVLGNAYSTNAIFQINILHDVDNIAVAAPQNLVNILTGDNHLNNYAALHNYDFSAVLPTGTASAQFGWNVEVSNGDFYNVNVLSQLNVMVDGDISYQTTQSSYYQAITGANRQFNGMILDDQGQPFDLIIVAGNYHHANIIDQTNVVLNDDFIRALLTANNADGLSISSGNNSLTNAAAISTYGPTSFSKMSGDLAAHAQGAQDGAYDQTVANYVPGQGPLNVLFITGNYYDLNIISQLNVLSDSNTALQALWQSAGPGTTSTLDISTGSNQAANYAEIISVGTLGAQYVAGEQYSDSMLLQANIIIQIPEGALNGNVDPNALVNEIVAFLDHGTAAQIPSHLETPSTTTAPAHDVMGGVLT